MEKSNKKTPRTGRFPGISLYVLLLIGFVFVLPLRNMAQNKIDLNLKDSSYKNLFLELQKQTGLNFVYNSRQLENMGPVSIDVRQSDVRTVLDQVLQKTPMTYSIEGNTIVIMPREKPRNMASQPQEIRVRGKVTDNNGEILVGVTIKIKDTAIGTVTDAGGEFQLAIPAGNNELLFSYIGYVTQQVSLDGRTVVNVSMQEDIQEMQEVVVTGYQDVKRERMTGSSSVITSRELRNKGLQSVDEILNGTISGVSTTTSGRPGEKARILIRGSTR